MISLRHFSFGYDPHRLLLEDVNMDFEAGKLTALIGRNGCGKSTLLRSIACLTGNYTGQILIDGIDSRGMTASELARYISFVDTSRIRVPNLKCIDLVALGRSPYTDWTGRLNENDRKIVRDALAMVGMEAFSERSVDKISDGECQRVMIARALAQQPDIIVLDEPTSFLDIKHKLEFLAVLKKLAVEKSLTVIMSLHEVELSKAVSDKIACFKEGKLDRIGPPNEIYTEGYIQELYGINLQELTPQLIELASRLSD